MNSNEWQTSKPPTDIECIFTNGKEMILGTLIDRNSLLICPSGCSFYDGDIEFDVKDITAWMPAPKLP